MNETVRSDALAHADDFFVEGFRQSNMTLEELRAHYEVEKRLADRLRRATPAERHPLYGTVYDELFERVPTHPQLVRKTEPAQAAAAVAAQVRLLRPLMTEETTFLEIGSGDPGRARADPG